MMGVDAEDEDGYTLQNSTIFVLGYTLNSFVLLPFDNWGKAKARSFEESRPQSLLPAWVPAVHHSLRDTSRPVRHILASEVCYDSVYIYIQSTMVQYNAV